MNRRATSKQAIVIGGSAGCLPVLLELIKLLPPNFGVPLIVVIHRQKSGVSELARILQNSTGHFKILEPEDKEEIKSGSVYIAPQNYHLLIEHDLSFGLDYSETVNYSRPSIDVTFESAASVYRKNLTGIILSGANNDGTAGLKKIVAYGGVAIAQDPAEAAYPAMPRSAAKVVEGIKVLTTQQISEYINGLPTYGK